MKKKELPLSVLQVLEPFVNLHGKQYTRIENDNTLLKLIDTDKDSDFHFTVEAYTNNKFDLTYKPYSATNTNNYNISISINELKNHFGSWIKLLEGYSKVNSIFDDPILKTYEEEFFSEFEILEEEKNKPLNNNQILFLDNYLENLNKGLEKYKEEENRIRIDNIQKEIKLLQETLTEKNKEQVVTSFSKILAKVKKLGVKYLKEFVTEGTKQIISTSIKYLIENGHNLIN